MKDADDKLSHDILKLCSVTVFRFMMTQPRSIDWRRSERIVFPTLFFLHDCGWIHSAASLLAQVASWQITAAGGDISVIASVLEDLSESIDRAAILRSDPNAIEMMLLMDGTLSAVRLLQTRQRHHRRERSRLGVASARRTSHRTLQVVANLSYRLSPSIPQLCRRVRCCSRFCSSSRSPGVSNSAPSTRIPLRPVRTVGDSDVCTRVTEGPAFRHNGRGILIWPWFGTVSGTHRSGIL